MRTEEEMMSLIIGTAEKDPRIRAVYMEGSRVNPAAPKDRFQDYDVVYMVEETETFQKDKGWIDRFGERLYMQYPDDFVNSDSDKENCYGWLIQFVDGNRLDLHVCTPKYVMEFLEKDGMHRVLLDKDNCLPPQTEPTDQQYWVKAPDQGQFGDTCNEFWWCLNNVAKGLWREELPYVMDMINLYIRPMLTRLLEWKIGMEHDYKVSVGKSAKYMRNFVSEEVYRRYLRTYSAAEREAVWEAVFVMCDLFQETAVEVSGALGLDYDLVEAGNSRRYLEDVRAMRG